MQDTLRQVIHCLLHHKSLRQNSNSYLHRVAVQYTTQNSLHSWAFKIASICPAASDLLAFANCLCNRELNSEGHRMPLFHYSRHPPALSMKPLQT